MTDCFF